jgi:aryl-alcohol dehydrogenase-like predicted oxidoreductase
MEYVNLGKAGVRVSRICLGCMSFGNDAAWKLEIDAARSLVKKSIDLGINFFDTANEYGYGRSEEILGECLNGYRDEMIVGTKLFFPMSNDPNDAGLSRRHIRHQVKDSLRRLRTDHLDLYQIHRWDYRTPIDETLRTLNDLVRSGTVHYLGASSMFAWQFLKALNTSERLGLERFVSMQNHYNLVYREEEREMIPLCKEEGIAILPWSPLARGFLSGKYRRGVTPKSLRYDHDEYDGQRLLASRYFKSEDFNVVEAAESLTKEKNVSVAQIALAWLFRKGVTSLVLGATKLEQIEDAVKSLDVELEAEELRRLEAPYKPHPTIGHG